MNEHFEDVKPHFAVRRSPKFIFLGRPGSSSRTYKVDDDGDEWTNDGGENFMILTYNLTFVNDKQVNTVSLSVIWVLKNFFFEPNNDGDEFVINVSNK